MADMTELKNIVRLGTVQSVNASKMTARVKFKDKGGITSGDLRIIKRPVYVVPAMESGAEGQTAKTTLKYDYNGQMLKEVSHNHEAFVTEWTPGVNDMVLCIMVPDGDGDGHDKDDGEPRIADPLPEGQPAHQRYGSAVDRKFWT